MVVCFFNELCMIDGLGNNVDNLNWGVVEMMFLCFVDDEYEGILGEEFGVCCRISVCVVSNFCVV